MNFRKWIFIAIFLFGIGMVLGMTASGTIANLFSEDLAALAELGSILEPFKFTTAIFILLKNLLALIVSFIFSPLFCLMPVLTLTVNGGLLSFISGIAVEQESLGFVIAALLPHGIIELPALIMGEAAALSFGAMAIILVFKKESRTVLVSTVTKNAGRVLLTLALFFVVGIFHTIIIVALFKKDSRRQLLPNLKQNLRYLMIAFGLLVPAAIIETYVTPLLLTQ